MQVLHEGTFELASSGVEKYASSTGITLAIMICGLSIIAIGALTHFVSIMRFDRMAESGELEPAPEGFDPELETRREFHIRSQLGVTFGLVLGGGLFILVAMIIAFNGIVGGAS